MDSSCVAACTEDIALAKWLALMTCDPGVLPRLSAPQVSQGGDLLVLCDLFISQSVA